MKKTDQEFKDIIAEILLIDPTSAHPKIHPARKEMKKGALQKQLDDVILKIEESELDVDILPYKEALVLLRKMRPATGEYDALLKEIVMAYHPNRYIKATKKAQINPKVTLTAKNIGQ